MAEDEIRKHTKAVYNTMLDKEKGWKHKLKDILIEILIIIFAVSVSIWLHNWSDGLHERKEEKEFLTGLLNDLQGDKTNMQNSLQFYNSTLQGLQYFARIGAGDSLNNDSLQKYRNLFFSYTELEPNKSRYEGIKGSGKFNIIENKQLLNDIIALHESTITHIEMLNNNYIQFTQKLTGLIGDKVSLDKAGHITNGQSFLQTSQMRILLNYGISSIEGNLVPDHEEGIKKCNELINEIHKELQ